MGLQIAMMAFILSHVLVGAISDFEALLWFCDFKMTKKKIIDSIDLTIKSFLDVLVDSDETPVM